MAKITISALKYANKGLVLDLGCTQGKEALFLAHNGFDVTAVDLSDVAINQLEKFIKEKKIKNITTVKFDVNDFTIKETTYDLITVFNVLYFLDRQTALKVIKEIKSGLAIGGVVAMSLFSIKYPFYNESKKHRFYVISEEIKELFSEFEIFEYFDGMIDDSGHTSLPEPHQHGVVLIIAKRIK